MLTASKLADSLAYAAPEQNRRDWFSWHTFIVSGIFCGTLLVVLMLIVPLAHAIYQDFGVQESSIIYGLWIVSQWLGNYYLWTIVLLLPVGLSLMVGILRTEPREPLDVERALVLAVPLACVVVAGSILFSAVPFIQYHRLLQDSGKAMDGAITFPGYQPLFRYLAMKEIGKADQNTVAGFTAACKTEPQYWTLDNNSELLVITPTWSPTNGGMGTLRNGRGGGSFYFVLHKFKTGQVSLVGTTSGIRYEAHTNGDKPSIITHSQAGALERLAIKSVWNGNRFENMPPEKIVVQEEVVSRQN